MTDSEKLGLFYLGREYDLEQKQLQDELVLYNAKDLTTHAICVGMTGSGKTGLCLSLLEEAAIDGIPAIVIDPKGDIGNLLLTFPELRPADFEPWVNPDDARRKDLSVEAYAQQQAAMWEKGLAEWGQGRERIRMLRESAEFVIYTPASNAGVPVSILSSFGAPPPEVLADDEMFRERVATIPTSLLGLLGMDADPVRSREHVLIARILDHHWREGQDLDLAALIMEIQSPPFQRVGVFDLDSFYPSKDRFALAMQLNTLLASPGFEAWLDGVPLDIDQILYTPKGKPRIAIFSIAHLSDSERMFFVSLLLNQVLSWMRTQPGTTSLRSLLYVDELFGYLPPNGNPPSKTPFLTLLKQARAFGLGLVLATQNPVDLDYKALSNAGTWLIGRLQTDQDKQRLLDGLEGAASGEGGFQRSAMEKVLSQLGNRVFLMHNVHQDGPVIFSTRWVMSYLRGPLTRQDIKSLMDPYKAVSTGMEPVARPFGATAPVAGGSTASTAASASAARPALPPDVPEFFAPIRRRPAADATLLLQPACLGAAQVHFVDRKLGVEEEQQVVLATPITSGVLPVVWGEAQPVPFGMEQLEREAPAGATYGELPAEATKARSYTKWKNDLAGELIRTLGVELFRNPALKAVSNPGESERDFRIRLQLLARERRDEQTEALRKKYSSKMNTLSERLRKAEQRHQKEMEQSRAEAMNTAVSVGMTLLGALTGKKSRGLTSLASRGTTAARGLGRSLQKSQDVTRAADSVEAIRLQLAELEEEFAAEAGQIEQQFEAMVKELESLTIRPKKSDVSVQLTALVWMPYGQGPSGELEPLYA